MLTVPHAIFHESAYSFLGLGLPAHQASLGNILNDGQRSLLAGGWWIALFPGLALLVGRDDDRHDRGVLARAPAPALALGARAMSARAGGRRAVGRLSHAARVVQALSEASVTVAPGELLLVVGESGSGKTVLAHALLRLLPRNVNVTGSVRLGGQDLLGLGARRSCAACAAGGWRSSRRARRRR